MPTTDCRTGIALNYEISGEGDPLVLIMGTSGSIPLWGEVIPRLDEHYRVIAFDNRGLRGSERGGDTISVASMAEDVSALLHALDVPRAHVMGWSLGSAVVQELALAHPEQVASAIMYATWGRCDGFQRSILTALRLPYAIRDMDAALATGSLAFPPQMLAKTAFQEI